jgi:hypothetical protein
VNPRGHQNENKGAILDNPTGAKSFHALKRKRRRRSEEEEGEED